jgi:hypothetical protein
MKTIHVQSDQGTTVLSHKKLILTTFLNRKQSLQLVTTWLVVDFWTPEYIIDDII